MAVFLVEHGSSKGLGTQDNVVIFWEQVDLLMTRYQQAQFYIIACNAITVFFHLSTISNLRRMNAPFVGAVDALIGAYLVAALGSIS